jgi:hypothetical protein
MSTANYNFFTPHFLGQWNYMTLETLHTSEFRGNALTEKVLGLRFAKLASFVNQI